MSLIEHWVCENCDSVDPPTFNGDEKACGACAAEGENGLLVRLVPASQLRGAVDLLEQAVSLIAQPTVPAAARERWQSAVDDLLGDGTAGGR